MTNIKQYVVESKQNSKTDSIVQTCYCTNIHCSMAKLNIGYNTTVISMYIHTHICQLPYSAKFNTLNFRGWRSILEKHENFLAPRKFGTIRYMQLGLNVA